MARKTAEQLRQERAAPELTREALALTRRTKSLETNPLRLLQLMARAEKYAEANYAVFEGRTAPEATEEKPLRVQFTFVNDEYTDEETLSVFSEDWELDQIEQRFNAFDEARAAELKRIETARNVYDNLSQEQRDAIGLLRRP